MAHVLTDDSILKLHQTLHGYLDGHRLLASSIPLKLRDARTMLVMSDASGPRASVEDVGYLTGYPLTDSGFYALARTWPAREIPRPGCVWTHTLLIDFADLASLTQMEFLMNAFRRPKENAYGDYQSELTISDLPFASPSMSSNLSGVPLTILRQILWALYSQPRDRICAFAETNSSELVLLLWGQQWPRLRRTFRFCTLSFADRSGDAGAFDLQFVPARERSIRSRFSDLTDADRLQPEPEEWLDDAVCDLREGGSGKLRAFFREVGGDISGGREAFIPFSRLHRLVQEFAHRPTAIDDAVSLLDDSFESESASSLRAVVTSVATSHPEALGERAIAFVMNHLDLLKDSDINEKGARLGAVLWTRDPEAFENLYSRQPPWPRIAQEALASVSVEDLLVGLNRHPDFMRSLIARRPDLLAQPSFWAIRDSWQAASNVVAASAPDQINAAVAAMLSAKRDDLAADLARTFGSGQILRAIGNLSSFNSSETQSATVSAWLSTAILDKNAVAAALSTHVIVSRVLLAMIAHCTEPDFVPNDYGEDPWWSAARSAQGDLSEQELQYFSAYLLARALGHRSRNPAELISIALDGVYLAAYQSRLSNAAWLLMERLLPWSFFWQDWDYCKRIRAGIVEAFLRRKLSPSVFAQVTVDDRLFFDLVQDAAEKGRAGRRFLKRVKRELLNSTDGNCSARIKIVSEFE